MLLNVQNSSLVTLLSQSLILAILLMQLSTGLGVHYFVIFFYTMFSMKFGHYDGMMDNILNPLLKSTCLLHLTYISYIILNHLVAVISCINVEKPVQICSFFLSFSTLYGLRENDRSCTSSGPKNVVFFSTKKKLRVLR